MDNSLCTINLKPYRVANGPVTFYSTLGAVPSTDTIQFDGGEAPSGPNCTILSNNHVLIGTCVYECEAVAWNPDTGSYTS